MSKPFVQKEASDKERYLICAEDEFILESCKSDNIGDDEIKIISIEAIGCPKKRVCADLDKQGRSTYCVHLSSYPFMVTGDKLLVTANPGEDKDKQLLEKLGLEPIE